MTATVTTTYARAPIADVLSVESVKGLSDADLKKTYGMIWAPGQLWERVAELSATGLNYTERMERVKFDRIVSAAGRLSRESESRHHMRGPDAKYAPAHRSGVIESGTRRPNNVRAGECIK